MNGDNRATLTRFGYTPLGTFGRLELPDGWVCYTDERPWRDNVQRLSCIPEGTYTLRLRTSPIVTRITRGGFLSGWEVRDVPGRTYIMLHPANTMHDVEGCIGPGATLGYVDGRWAVTDSQATFRDMMARMGAADEWTLTIQPFQAVYP